MNMGKKPRKNEKKSKTPQKIALPLPQPSLLHQE
jgi:hypothetical protein